MKKFAIKSVVAAVSALAAFSASAALNLDSAPTANKYATQLVVDGTTGLPLLDGAITDLNLSAAHGVAPGVNVTSYVRFDLTNGAKFVNNPTLAVAAGASTTGAGTGTISSGGQGQSFVVFALSPTNPAHSIQADGLMTLTVDAAGIRVFNKDSVAARARVFETLTSAVNESSSLKDSTARTVITFANGITATPTTGSLTADVAPATGSAYTKFTPAVALGSVIGKVVFAAETGVAKADGTQLTLADALSNAASTADSDLTVTGDFSFLKGAAEAYADNAVKARVFLDSATTCAGGATATTKTVSATSVIFADIASANLGTHHICVVPEGSVAIPTGSYTAAMDYKESSAAYSVTDFSGVTVGSISRNGTTLVAPLTNQPAGWYSRLVLVNTGTDARTYTVTAVSESGTTVTLTGDAAGGTLAGNATKVISLQDPALTSQLASVSGGAPRFSLQVVVNAPSSAITGSYQIVNSTGASISNQTLVSK